MVTIANGIVFHSLSLFIQDTKDLISAHVKKSIAVQIKSDQQVISSHGKARKAALQHWIKSDQPLSWTPNNSRSSGAYMLLITILHSDPYSKPSDLQKSLESYSYTHVAKLMCNISKKGKPVAPVTPNGSFFPCLPLALARIQNSLPFCENESPEAPVIAIFSKMLSKLKIHFIPWHKCETQNSHAYVVQANWWMMIKASPMAELSQQLPKKPEEVHAEITDHVMAADPNAPWSLPRLLQDMGPLWRKYTLPSDWSLDAASIPSSIPGSENHYVRATYEYVEAQYNGRLWWHHLSLVWGILFSKITPYVFAPRGNVPLTTAPLNDQIHGLKWERGTSKNHGGCSMPLPFVTMVSTTILALLDSSSPLSKRIAENKNALGKPWTTKHGMSQSRNLMVSQSLMTCLFREQGNTCGQPDTHRRCRCKTEYSFV
jgi:hypothetical protein